MLTTYRRALELPGAWQFSTTGFVARLPMAMIGLGIVLLISAQTGSYALAGALSATYQVSAATGNLVTSRIVDRVGQHRLLPWLALANAVLLVTFVGAVDADLPMAMLFALIALAGAAQPAIGSMVRARWAHAATDADRLRSAFALESIIDELIFTIGPLLTATLAFRYALPLPLVVGAVIGLGGGMVLAAQRATEPPPSARLETGGSDTPVVRSAVRMPGMLLVVVGALGVGGVFGTYEVAVVAFTEQSGEAGAAGIILGLWAAGSMAGGLVFGSRQWRLPLPAQLVVLTGVMGLVLIPAPFVRTTPGLAVTAAIAGAAVAPALIAIFSLSERLVPSRLLTEGLTWTNSGLAMGFAAGMTIGGVVTDAYGTAWAFVLPGLSALASFLTAAFGQRVLRRASAGRPQPLPAVTWIVDPLPGPTPGGIVDDPEHQIGEPDRLRGD